MATAKITEKYARSLEWHGAGYVVWDAELDGFGVRVWGKGSKRGYVVQVKRDGRSFRKALGRVGEVSQDKARAQAITYRGIVKDGRDPRAEEQTERGAWTLQDAMNYFLGAYVDAKGSSEGHIGNAKSLFKHHVPDRWKTTKLRDISHEQIAKRFRVIAGGTGDKDAPGGASRANLWLALMSKLFALGEGKGYVVKNPCRGIDKIKTASRERYLSAREIGTLWDHLSKHKNTEAASFAQLILVTGARPIEVANMEWAHLDKHTGVWTKPPRNTKARRQHVVRLSERAMRVLGRLDTYKRSRYVFPSTTDASKPRDPKLKKFWNSVRKACGLPGVRLYDCRHSFASWLAMGGATELELAALLGHNSTQITKRYVHLAADHLKQRADIMGDVIRRALEEYPPDQIPIVAEEKKNGVIVQTLLPLIPGEDY